MTRQSRGVPDGRLPTQRQVAGQHYEQMAADFLCRRGLQLLQRNFRCRRGEIDLVMRDGNTLVFVEVRYRRSNHHGGASASITANKQRRITHCARHYLLQLQSRGETLPPCRFDVVAITAAAVAGADKQLDWLVDAFRVSG